MSNRERSDTIEGVLPDDDATWDFPEPSEALGGVTMPEQASPLHVPESARSRVATIQGLPSLNSPGFMAPGLSSAQHGFSGHHAPDGPTAPDGIALTDSASSWETATDPDAGRHVERVVPRVPSPDSAKIELSKSMEIQVANLDDEPRVDPRKAPAVQAAHPRRRPQAQTELLLPALEKKKKAARQKESSDWPLVLGLVVLVFVIFVLAGLVTLGVMGQLGG